MIGTSGVRIIVAAIFIVAMASGCSAKTDRNSGLQLVRLASRAGVTSAPLFIADAEGFFAKERIKIEYDLVSSSLSQSIPSLERERVDVIAATLNVGFFNAIARGAHARMVADRVHLDPASCDFVGIVGRGSLFDSDDPPAAQLRGTKVSSNSVGAFGYIFANFLRSKGLTESDVKFIPLSDDVTPQALHDGSVDLVITGEPRLTPLIKAGNRIVGSASKYAPGFQYGVMIFGPKLLVRDRDLGQRFMNAYLRGVRQYNKGRTPRNLDIISRLSGIDSARLAALCLPTVKEDGGMDFSSLIAFQKWAVETGNQTRVLAKAEISDTEFARRAVALLAKDIETK